MRISRRLRFLISISSLVIYFALGVTLFLLDLEDFGELDVERSVIFYSLELSSLGD